MPDAPRPSPKLPDDSAPLSLERTPSHFPVTAEYVARKLKQRDESQWRPSKRTPLWAALFIGIVGSSAPALMIALPAPWNAVAGSALLGAAGSLATYFGMKSAGERKQ